MLKDGLLAALHRRHCDKRIVQIDVLQCKLDPFNDDPDLAPVSGAWTGRVGPRDGLRYIVIFVHS